MMMIPINEPRCEQTGLRGFRPGASFINKVPRTNLKSVLGPFLGRA